MSADALDGDEDLDGNGQGRKKPPKKGGGFRQTKGKVGPFGSFFPDDDFDDADPDVDDEEDAIEDEDEDEDPVVDGDEWDDEDEEIQPKVKVKVKDVSTGERSSLYQELFGQSDGSKQGQVENQSIDQDLFQ
jgi:hypothetical protein